MNNWDNRRIKNVANLRHRSLKLRRTIDFKLSYFIVSIVISFTNTCTLRLQARQDT